MTIFETIKRLQRIPRPHRVAHLRALVRLERPRSQRRAELMAALCKEMLSQLRKENRAA